MLTTPRTRVLALAVIYAVAAGCGDGAPTRVENEPRVGSARASMVTDGEDPTEETLLDHGPAAGRFSECYPSETGGEHQGDSFAFPDGGTITEVVIFSCINAFAPLPGPVHVAFLADDEGFPGGYLYEADVDETSIAFTGSTGAQAMVTVRVPMPFAAEAGQRYWVSVSGNGFDLGQAAVHTPEDGAMARFGGRDFQGPALIGDMMFQLRGFTGRVNRSPTATLSLRTLGAEGATTTFALAAADEDGDAITYSADFGDGTPALTGSVAGAVIPIDHAYADDNGGRPYSVTITVSDGRGGSGTAAAEAVVANVSPSVAPVEDARVSPGSTFTLSTSFTDPGSKDGPWAVRIDWGDGTELSTTVQASGPFEATHVYAERGTFAASLTVTDKDGGVGALTATVEVTNRPPTVEIASAQTADEGSAVRFAATAADADGDTLTYAWDFDGDAKADTTTRVGAVMHTYPDDGVRQVSVTVDDGRGGAASASQTVTITNVAPMAAFGAPVTVNEGQLMELTVSNLTDASAVDAASLVAAFSCGGDAYGPFGSARAATCAAPDDAVRKVGAQVKDKDGGVSAYTRSVTVLNTPPTVDAGPDRTVGSGELVTLSGTFSDPGAADSPWSWSWSSGQAGTALSLGQALPASYRACTAATLTLTVTDKDGGVGSDAVTIAVHPVGPSMDVKPDPMQLNSNGFLTTTILSSASFDARSLDPATVRLSNEVGAGTMVDRKSDGSWNWVSDRDVDGDGRMDAQFRFRRDDLVRNGDLSLTTTQLVLTGVAGACAQVRAVDQIGVR